MSSAIEQRLKKMEILFDQEEFVVIDMGTGYIKAGFSGEDLPRVVMPTVVAEQVVELEEQGNAQVGEVRRHVNHCFGNAAFKSRDTEPPHELHYPIQRGIITDPENCTKLIRHIFTKELGLDTNKMNVLMTDSPRNTKKNKMKIAEIMFEELNVHSFALMNTAVLSLFSTGRTSGLVAECGEGLTYTVPIYEGYALPHALHTLEIAGGDVTRKLMRELQNADIKVNENHLELIRDMKEQMCHVAYDFDAELHSKDDPLDQEQRSYELPSGEIIEVNHRKRISASEILFNPNSAPEVVQTSNQDPESCLDGITSLAFQAIERCDADLKINLYKNIVLAGGTTLMKGFSERFEQKIREAAEGTSKNEIEVNASLHRKYAAWIGGSMISSFSTFSDQTIKSNDYKEQQPENERSTCILKKTVY